MDLIVTRNGARPPRYPGERCSSYLCTCETCQHEKRQKHNASRKAAGPVTRWRLRRGRAG